MKTFTVSLFGFGLALSATAEARKVNAPGGVIADARSATFDRPTVHLNVAGIRP